MQMKTSFASFGAIAPAIGAVLLACASANAASEVAPVSAAAKTVTMQSAPTIAAPTAQQVNDREVFLSPFLPSARPSMRLPGAVEVDFLPELVDMIPEQGVFDLVQFPFPDGTLRDLWLTEFRVTSETTTIAVMEQGKNGEPVANYGYAPQVRTFRGRVTGVDNSLVYLAFSPTAVSGFINIEGQIFSVSNGPRGDMPVVVSDIDNLPEGAINWYQYTCQVRDGGAGGNAGGEGDGGVAALATCKVMEMAFETDNEFRGLFGSEQAAINYATQIVAGMNTIYLNQENLYPIMSFLRVWAPGVSDPWSASGSGAQLDQFVAAWGGGGGPTGSNPRDLAHMISARDLGGGVAYLNAVCNPNIGFAVSGNLSGFFPYPLQNNNGQNWDIVVTTHETGHNCGCHHTHDLGVDNCVGGACISTGTIMSYCHLCPGGLANIVLQFAPANKVEMDTFLAGAGCLSQPCPIYDPASFTASDGSFVDAVRLGWIAPAIAPLNYQIERRVLGSPTFASLNSNVSSSATTYDDTTAVVGTVYEYRIRAVRVDTGNPSSWIGPDQGYKGVLGPTGLQASDGEFSDKVSLAWTAPSGYTPAAYYIYRATAGGTMRKLDEVTAGTSYNDAGTYTSFDSTWPDTDGDNNPGPPPATEPGIVYYYEVRAKVSGTIISAPSADTGFRATGGPTNLIATGALNSTTPPLSDRVRLTWALPGTVNAVYIYRSANGQPFVQVDRLSGSQTRWNDLFVAADVAYTYRVRSFSNFLGMSAPSDIDLGFVLPPPSMASASAGTSANVTVTWSKPTSWAPASYTLWRKRSGSDPWPATPLAADLTASTFSFVDTTGEAGAVYVYAVTGKSAQFNSSSDRGVTATGYPRVLPPTAVVASDGAYPGYVQVSWTPTGTSTGVSWEVWRRRAGTTEAYTKIRTVTQPVVLDTTAIVGVTYQYYVTTRASNGVTSAASATDNGFR